MLPAWQLSSMPPNARGEQCSCEPPPKRCGPRLRFLGSFEDRGPTSELPCAPTPSRPDSRLRSPLRPSPTLPLLAAVPGEQLLRELSQISSPLEQRARRQ